MDIGNYPLTLELVIIISSWGGLIHYFQYRYKRKKRASLWQLLRLLFTANFVGILVAAICIENKISNSLTIVYCGLAGHMGERILYMLEQKYLLKKR